MPTEAPSQPSFAGEPDAATRTTFVEEVAPHLRERVAERRASAPIATSPPGGGR